MRMVMTRQKSTSNVFPKDVQHLTTYPFTLVSLFKNSMEFSPLSVPCKAVPQHPVLSCDLSDTLTIHMVRELIQGRDGGDDDDDDDADADDDTLR